MKAAITLLLSLCICSSSFSQLKAYFTYCSFFSPGDGPYLETYLSVIGNSVIYQKKETGKFQGSIEITVLFRQGEEIKNFKKYNLLSPELDDTLNGFVNFIDQQRFRLPSGTYNLELSIADKNSPSLPFKSVQPLTIDFSADKIFISEIELIESYKPTSEQSILSKSGYDLVPYVSNFFPKSMEKVVFYCELYNTETVLGKDEKYLVNYFIESHETGKVLNNFRGFVRQTAKPVNVVLSNLSISNLPSGNYDLVVEMRSRNNDLLSQKKIFFQRSNPDLEVKPEDISMLSAEGTFVSGMTNKDSLLEYIHCLRPISTETEVRFVENNFKKEGSLDTGLMQKFFLNFWSERNHTDPGKEWEQYRQMILHVNKVYGTRIKKGYETDRGRIYLKYGKPNSVIDRPNQEDSYYPYQIWHFYKTEKRSNAKFVFYNTDMVSNDYQLLHSNVLGEANDYRWQYRLRQRNTSSSDLDRSKGDVNSVEEKYDPRLDDFWNNPR